MSIKYYLIFIVLVVFVLLADIFLYKPLKNFCRFCCCSKKITKVNPLHKFGTYRQEYPKMSMRMLASYDIRLNNKYTDIIKAIDAG